MATDETKSNLSGGPHIKIPHTFKTRENIRPLGHFSSYILAFTILRRAREKTACTQLGVRLLAEREKTETPLALTSFQNKFLHDQG